MAAQKGRIVGVKSLTDARKAKLRTRWQEPAFRDGWARAVESVAESTFCQGKNDHGWVVSFDWLIRNTENYVKALEGRYANNDGNGEAAEDPSELGPVEILHRYQARAGERAAELAAAQATPGVAK